MPAIDTPYATRPKPKKARKVKVKRANVYVPPAELYKPDRRPVRAAPPQPSPDARDVTARSPAQKRRDRRAVRESIRTSRERVREDKLALSTTPIRLPRARPLRRTEVAPNPDQRLPADVPILRRTANDQPSRSTVEAYKATPEYVKATLGAGAERRDDKAYFATHKHAYGDDTRPTPKEPKFSDVYVPPVRLASKEARKAAGEKQGLPVKLAAPRTGVEWPGTLHPERAYGPGKGDFDRLGGIGGGEFKGGKRGSAMDEPRTEAEMRKFLKTGVRPYGVKKKRRKKGKGGGAGPMLAAAGGGLTSALAPLAAAGGKEAVKGVIAAGKLAGKGRRAYLGAFEHGSLGPIADPVTKFAYRAAIKDPEELVVTAPSSTAHLAKTAWEDPGRAIKELAAPYADVYHHPGHLKRMFWEHPTQTYLQFAPVARFPGLALGRGLRLAGKQTLTRPSATLPGTAIEAEQRGSRDAFMRAVQARRDKAGAPTISTAELQRQVDEHFDLERKVATAHINAARRQAKADTKGQPKEVREKAIRDAEETAAEEAALASRYSFARQFGATERPHVTQADVDAANAVKEAAKSARKGAKTASELAAQEARDAYAASQAARGREGDRLPSEAAREQAYKDLVRAQETARKPEREFQQAHAGARVNVAQGANTSPRLAELEARRRAIVAGREPTEVTPSRVVTHREATPPEFDAPFREALAGEHGAYLTDYKPHERAGHKLLLSRDSKAGAAVKPDGDIVSVFRLPGGTKGDGQRMLRAAVENGGTKLDAFGEGLRKFYEQQGFRVVDSVAWDDKYAPKGWNYERDGRPRVYFMEYSGPRGSATRAAPGAVSGEAEAGAGAVAGAGGQRGGALAGAPGPDVPGLGRPAGAPGAGGAGPAATAAAVAHARRLVSTYDREHAAAQHGPLKGEHVTEDVVDARRGVRIHNNHVTQAQRRLDRLEQQASHAEGVTEGLTKGGKMTAGAGKRAADLAEQIGHAREDLADARGMADAARERLKTAEADAKTRAVQVTKGRRDAARQKLKDAEAAHRQGIRERTADIDKEIAAEKRRLAGVAPGQADRLAEAIEGRETAQNTVAAARSRARLLDRIVAGDRRALVLRRRGLHGEARDRATAAREAHRDAVAEFKQAKADAWALEQERRNPQLVDPDTAGRLFDNRRDANKLKQQLNARGQQIPSGHFLGQTLELRETPGGGRRVVREAGGMRPLEFTVHQVGDQWAVVPKIAAARRYGSGGPGSRMSHANVGTAEATMAKVLRNTRNQFTQATLPASFKWLAGQGTEALIRSVLTGAGAIDLYRFNQVVRQLEDIQPGAGELFKQRILGGGMFGHTGTIREQIGREPGPSMAETFEGTKLRTPANLATWIGQKGGLPAVRARWRDYSHGVMNVVNGAIESTAHRAMAGHAIRHGPLMERRLIGLTDRALRDAAQGLRGTPAQTAAARMVDEMYGKYSKWSPDAREALLHWTPFAPWYRNAATFLLKTLPVDHPFRAALLANITAIEEDWRKEQRLSYFGADHRPSYMMGGYPTGRGGIYNLGHYWMGGAFQDPWASAAELTLPQFSTPILNMRGIDWRNRQLQNPSGLEFTGAQRGLRAGASLLEAELPLASQAFNLSGLEGRLDRRRDIPPFSRRLKGYLPWAPLGDPVDTGGVDMPDMPDLPDMPDMPDMPEMPDIG
jgi:hypothetical protein